jgi:hypothetical protein
MTVLTWLATSPIGGFAKVAAAGMLVWVIDNVGSLQIPQIVQVGLIAGLPILINWMNPDDPRYGKSGDETCPE